MESSGNGSYASVVNPLKNSVILLHLLKFDIIRLLNSLQICLAMNFKEKCEENLRLEQ